MCLFPRLYVTRVFICYMFVVFFVCRVDSDMFVENIAGHVLRREMQH